MRETIEFYDGLVVENAEVFGNRYVRFLLTVKFPAGTLPANAEDILEKNHIRADVVRFADKSGYINMLSLLGKNAGVEAINEEIDAHTSRLDWMFGLEEGTCKAHTVFSMGSDSERWDDLLLNEEKKILEDAKVATMIAAHSDDEGFACPICGAKVFESSQTCYHDVFINSKNDFVGDIRIGEADKPEGSAITCARCGAEIGDSIPEEDEDVEVKDGEYVNLGDMANLKLANAATVAKELGYWEDSFLFPSLVKKVNAMGDEEKVELWKKVKFRGANIGNLRCGFGLE